LNSRSLQTPDRAIRIATDLVNSDLGGVETLATPDELRRFLLDHAEPEPVDVTDVELAEIHQLRHRLRAVYGAADDHTAARVLNELFAAHATRPYLSEHDETPWHVHVTSMDADWAEWMAATTAMGLAMVVAGHGFDALRRCRADNCERVFVTTTTRRTRRFCSSTCATRTRVSSHRARQRLHDLP
jgi:predicted RNA-binding Zn ribbon-like protein